MSLDFSRCRLPPFRHQKEDVQALIDHPYFFIASEMRTGKSAIVVLAAQFLFEMGIIDKVIVVTPAPVRDVWADPELGELAKHLWSDLPSTITEYHATVRVWHHANVEQHDNRLYWYVTNFEFLRSQGRLKQLLPACGPKTLLVGDESSFLKNASAQQTKSFALLRRSCGRVVLLNGTPIFHSPMDLFSQGNILHPSILDCQFVTHFKARYAVQEPVLGFGGKPLQGHRGQTVMKVAAWTNLDDLQRRFAPITVRRLQKECLDLPPKLDPVTLTATLAESWPHYKQMRDDMVVWLKNDKVATSATAAIRALRLSQITGGFLGGVEDARIGESPVQEGLLESLVLPGMAGVSRPSAHDAERMPGNVRVETVSATQLDEMLEKTYGKNVEIARAVVGAVQKVQDDMFDIMINGSPPHPEDPPVGITGVQAVGREKLDVLLWFIGQRLEADPNLHLVTWCRFRPELFRMMEVVQAEFPQFTCGMVCGGQKRDDRLAALALLKPETSPKGPVFIGGIEGTGSFGLDMTAAHTCVTMSSGYSPGRSAQTLDRVYGPGQKNPISYFSILAVGPKNQRTIDHQIEIARRNGADIASWTSDYWVRVLTEE